MTAKQRQTPSRDNDLGTTKEKDRKSVNAHIELAVDGMEIYRPLFARVSTIKIQQKEEK